MGSRQGHSRRRRWVTGGVAFVLGAVALTLLAYQLWLRDWWDWRNTDFATHSVDLDEIMSGGPPKDGIPSIDSPLFVDARSATGWIDERDPVITVHIGADHRAYPLQVLLWHEIVNDTVGGVPIVVTYCPLCDSAAVYARTAGERTLTFGTTGKLRKNDMVMYDRETQSWWQQVSGEAIVGTLTGTKLRLLPSNVMALSELLREDGNLQLMKPSSPGARDYGQTPYPGHGRGEMRVLVVHAGGTSIAVPLSKAVTPRNYERGGARFVVWSTGVMAAPLHSKRISEAPDIASAAAFSRDVAGQTFTFVARHGDRVDRETGSIWNAMGTCISGPMRGKQLSPMTTQLMFASTYADFASSF